MGSSIYEKSGWNREMIRQPENDQTLVFHQKGATLSVNCARADILIENFRPGGLSKYGLDYHSIFILRPGIICALYRFWSEVLFWRPGYDF